MGFDLDMTLVDSRPGIHAALTAYRADTGVPVDPDAVVASLGPPVQTVLLPLVGPDRLDAEVATFRRYMAEIGVRGATPLPGAVDALAAVRARGGRTVVVTAKHQPLAEATLRHAGLPVDVVAGDVWSTGKAGPLREHKAVAYVGDHTADIEAARAAGVVSVAVTTGPIDAAGLAAADHVLAGRAAGAAPDVPTYPEGGLLGRSGGPLDRLIRCFACAAPPCRR